jgi:hypothetical protein
VSGLQRTRKGRWPDMALTAVYRNSAADRAALHEAFACCTAAIFQAWRGDQDPALLSLLEAEIDALNVMLAAIKQAANRSAGNTAGAAPPFRHALSQAGRRGGTTPQRP